MENWVGPQVHAVPEEDYVALPYNSMERPVINGEDSVPLKFAISWVLNSTSSRSWNLKFFKSMFFCPSLQQIVGLDEKNQILTTNIWFVLSFLHQGSLNHDPYLSKVDNHLLPSMYHMKFFNFFYFSKIAFQVDDDLVRPFHAMEWIRAQQYQCKAIFFHIFSIFLLYSCPEQPTKFVVL